MPEGFPSFFIRRSNRAVPVRSFLKKSPRNDKKRDFEKIMGAGLPVFCLAYLSKDKERNTVGGQPYSFDEKGAAVAAPFMVLF